MSQKWPFYRVGCRTITQSGSPAFQMLPAPMVNKPAECVVYKVCILCAGRDWSWESSRADVGSSEDNKLGHFVDTSVSFCHWPAPTHLPTDWNIYNCRLNWTQSEIVDSSFIHCPEKKVPLHFCPLNALMLTDFQNSFYWQTLRSKFDIWQKVCLSGVWVGALSCWNMKNLLQVWCMAGRNCSNRTLQH